MTKLLPLCAVLTLIACSSAPDGVTVHDPYEAQNRSVHAFNKSLAQTLGGDDDAPSDGPAIPPVIGDRVLDFADNVALPGKVMNNVLQGNIAGAGTNTARFLVNTTVGLLGLWDPADAMGLTEVDTDFGQTLAVWGAPEGAYLEVPLIGPSTERDFAGDIVDLVLNPLWLVLSDEQVLVASLGSIAGRVVKIDQAGDVIGDVFSESADSYMQAQLIYLQNRRFELGLDDIDAVDPYDELFGDP